MHIGTTSMNNVTKVRATGWTTSANLNLVTLTAESDDAIILHHFSFETTAAGAGIARSFFRANGGKSEDEQHS